MFVTDRYGAILQFLRTLERFKVVERETYLSDHSRHETDAEHSWHTCLFALLLARELREPVDVGRVLELILVHDLPEILAGDTFAYDAQAREGKARREEEAARELFAVLPDDLRAYLFTDWREFEALTSPRVRQS